jgi:polysaccharide export outer membrane protein
LRRRQHLTVSAICYSFARCRDLLIHVRPMTSHTTMTTASGTSAADPMRLIFLAAFAVCVAFAGRAFAAEPPSAPVTPPESKVASDYMIGPGDTLQVFVWRNPELTATVPVRPDGKISTPLVEDMVAVGKTPSQLARDIEKVLGEYVRSPQINVIVTQPASVFSQVKVIGQVLHPQSLAYRDGLTVLDAVLAVGGLAPFAAGNRAKVIRTENGKQRDIKVKLSSLVNNGDMTQNVTLVPGDVIVIPESRF